MKRFKQIKDAADWIDAHYPGNLSLATPLGLGKPNQLLNQVYDRIKKNTNRSLQIYTALSPQIPHPTNDLEKRFTEPFVERHFGKDYPELHYSLDLARNEAPGNVKVHEFYFQAGTALNHREMQRNYMSVNYTHVAQAIHDRGVPLLLCLIAKHPNNPKKFSLSCNPDLTLDLVEIYKKNGNCIKVVGVVHPDLPYMTEDAEVDENFFEVIVDSTEVNHELFALPHEPIAPSDFMIGLRASLLMPDDGTLQIGIGSLSVALIHALILRHRNNALYREMTNPLIAHQERHQKMLGEFHQGTFQKGLYGTSEMVMDAFMHLRRADILKREIFDSDDQIRRYLHGAFFMGSKEFYQWMRDRSLEHDHGLCMTRVSKVNDLYDPHELALRRQRKNARFYNMTLEIGLLGSVTSETLSNGQVISGVGGQYNFVSMSHELPDSHSVILFHSTHSKNGKRISNINWGSEQATLPRHLRDVFITEYGFSFTRGLSDETVIESNLEIADSLFQNQLRELAIKNGKLRKDYKLPKSALENSPAAITQFFKPYSDYIAPFPFGSDFTPTEERLVLALNQIKERLPFKMKILSLLILGLKIPVERYPEEIARMDLTHPKGVKQSVYQLLLRGSLSLCSG
jgi:acyl-CoA hydrolase